MQGQKTDPAAIRLNSQAMSLVAFANNSDSSRKAIALLDKATAIDSNYLLGHYNKLIFYNRRLQTHEAISTINKLIRLRPYAHDLYLTGGVLYELSGDTISSRNYFEKSLSICRDGLRSLPVGSDEYYVLSSNEAINLMMLGDSSGAQEILKTVQNNQTDEGQKKWTASIMQKSKKELIEFWSSYQSGK